MRVRVVIAIGIVLLIAAIWALSVQRVGASIGVIDVYQGGVSIRSEEGERVGSSGDTVRRDDVIVVPPGGRVGIVFDDGSVVRLDGGTVATIRELLMQQGEMVRGHIDLTEGQTWSNVRSRASEEFVVETPTVVATVRGTCFHVSYLSGVSTVYVSCGSVMVRLKEQRSQAGVLLTAGFVLRVRDAQAAGDLLEAPQLLSAAEKSEWIRWNEAADKAISPDTEITSSSSQSTSSRDASVTATSAATTSVTTASAAVSTPSRSIASSSRLSSRAVSAPASVSKLPATETFSLRLAVDRQEIDLADLAQFSVIATTSDGIATDEKGNVSWEVRPFGLGTVDRLGRFHPAQEGEGLVVASLRGTQSNGVSLRVVKAAEQTPPPVQPAAVTTVSVRVTCQKQSPAQGQTVPGLVTAQCTATALMSDQTTRDVTQGALWSVRGTAKGSVQQNGFYAAGSPQGTDTVSATHDGQSGSAQIVVP